MGRFINADGQLNDDILGYNMFAYCGNNPVMYEDANGEVPWLIIGIIAGTTILGGVLGGLSNKKLGKTEVEQDHSTDSNEDDALTPKDRVQNICIGAALGLAVGGAIVATGGAIGSVAVGSVATYIAAFGATGAQTFAWGAVIYDLIAMLLSTFLGTEMEMIEITP